MYNMPLHQKLICTEEWNQDVIVIKHFKDVCIGASFSFQIIEAFPGTGYKNSRVCPVNREARLDKEN